MIGESIGDVEEVDTSEWGRWLRIRVAVDLAKPLMRGRRLSLPGGDKILALFRYERLPDFCYVCGRVDHMERDCSYSKTSTDNDAVKFQYGPWLRADGPKLVSGMFSQTYAEEGQRESTPGCWSASASEHSGESVAEYKETEEVEEIGVVAKNLNLGLHGNSEIEARDSRMDLSNSWKRIEVDHQAFWELAHTDVSLGTKIESKTEPI